MDTQEGKCPLLHLVFFLFSCVCAICSLVLLKCKVFCFFVLIMLRGDVAKTIPLNVCYLIFFWIFSWTQLGHLSVILLVTVNWALSTPQNLMLHVYPFCRLKRKEVDHEKLQNERGRRRKSLEYQVCILVYVI